MLLVGKLVNIVMLRKSSTILAIFVISLLVAYVDYLVPQEVPIDILYAVPIWLAVMVFGLAGAMAVSGSSLLLFFLANYAINNAGGGAIPSQSLWPALFLTGLLFFGMGWGSYIFKLSQVRLGQARLALEKQVADLDVLYQSSQTLVERNLDDVASLIRQIIGHIAQATKATKIGLELNLADLEYLNDNYKLEEPNSTGTLLSFPLMVNGENFGVLKLVAANSNGDILVQALVRHLALALQNHYLQQQGLQLAVTAERNRLAREIHDVLAQGLSGILFQVEAARLNVTNQAALTQRLEQIEQLTRDNLQEARRSVANLRPLPLDGNNLVEALQQRVRIFSRENTIEAHFEVSGQPRDLPGEIEVALYRIAQEALSNIVRHAAASWTEVSLDYDEAEVCLTISDNGCGFAVKNPLALPAFSIEPASLEVEAAADGGSNKLNGNERRKFGLATMQERARLVGGLFNIESGIALTVANQVGNSNNTTSHRGSRVRIIVPYDKMKLPASR